MRVNKFNLTNLVSWIGKTLRIGVAIIVIVISFWVTTGLLTEIKVWAQTTPQVVTCTSFELKNTSTGATIAAGSTVTAGTKISYQPTGCSSGWNIGTRTAIVTNNNAFPTDHSQCADAGQLCQVTALYAGEGTRLYWRANLSKIINSSLYFCRHTGGWDSVPAGLAAPTGLSCGLGSGTAYAYVNVSQSTENRPCYTSADFCTTSQLANCSRPGGKYTLNECLASLQATACKLNATDYIVAVPSPNSKGWYDSAGARPSYVAGFSVYRSNTTIQSVELRGLSFYCPEGPDKAGGECTLNRVDIPPVGQPNIVKTFGANNNFGLQLARPIDQNCGAFQIDPYFVKINGQTCTKEAGTATYGVCNLINFSQKCNLPADWRARCSDQIPTSTPTPIPGSTATPTLSPTPSMAPLCVSVRASKTPINYGDRVTFTCGLVPSAASYEFRVIAPDGSVKYIPASVGNVSSEYVADNPVSGRYIAQCRVCANAQLCATDPNYGWDRNPYLP